MNTQISALPDLGWSAFYQSQLSLEECADLRAHRITQVHRSTLDLIGENGTQRINMNGMLVDHGVVVGDWILLDVTDQPVRVLARKSLLKRRSAGTDISEQLIASNVDTLFIVSSCNADFNIARLERYLVLAYQAEVEPVLVLTKSDLCDDPGVYLDKARAAFPNMLIEVIDATHNDTVVRLSIWCSKGQTLVLVGSSGVGKTTLSNTLTGLNIVTQEIREDDAKGKHTTTARSMYRMLSGGWLIDTPGIRALRLLNARSGVDGVFGDILQLIPECRFNDCAHETEPGCAVQRAIETGNLDPMRLKRWRKLMAEEAFNSQTLAQVRDNRKKWAKISKAGKAKSKAKRGDFM